MCARTAPSNFNPRPPRGERLQCERPGKAGKKFQSTPSARRATDKASPVVRMPLISIHALREESDLFSRLYLSIKALFQSTPSARRATLIVGDVNIQFPISIHALREESDQFPRRVHLHP